LYKVIQEIFVSNFSLYFKSFLQKILINTYLNLIF